MKRIFISHILPRDFEIKYNLSVAACNFSRNLIEGGSFDQFYSIMPTYVRDSLKEVDMTGLIYSPLRTKGNILSKLAIIHENWMLFKLLPNDSSVWIYNITTLTITLFCLLKWFKPKVKKNVIILDYTPKNDWLSQLCLWAINHADGTIKLAQSPLFTVSNTACLPGVTPINEITAPKQEYLNRKFLLSGVLNERISMISMVLDAFSKIKGAELHITGFLDDEHVIEHFKDYVNIHYHGKLSYDEYLKVFHDTTFQLSTRNPKSPENQCNFPSKVMEALLHNRIVVSTIRYEQLEDIKYLLVPSGKDDFQYAIESITNMSDKELSEYANQSESVKRLFNVDVWKHTMEEIESHERKFTTPIGMT